MKKYRNDLILVVVLLAISALLYLFYNNFNEVGAYAVVKVNGREVARYRLTKDGIYELNDGSNILVIENGIAYIKEANCPDKLCVKQGKIKQINQCITCLPNKLTVSIEGNDDGVDFVS